MFTRNLIIRRGGKKRVFSPTNEQRFMKGDDLKLNLQVDIFQVELTPRDRRAERVFVTRLSGRLTLFQHLLKTIYELEKKERLS